MRCKVRTGLHGTDARGRFRGGVRFGLGIVVWCAVAGCAPGDAGNSGDVGDYDDAGAPGAARDSGGPGALPQQPPTPVIRDSAGIRIIENARPGRRARSGAHAHLGRLR